MTLSDLTLPVDLGWSRQHALVFSQSLAERIDLVQQEVGDMRYHLEPTKLTDGRFFVGADVLTECVPGRFLYAAFSRLDSSRFGEIEVVPMADVVALLPVAPPLGE